MNKEASSGATRGGRGYHSILSHFERAEIERLPPALRVMLATLEIALSDTEPSAVQARTSCVEGWWFTWVEGYGLVHVRGNQESIKPNYLLLVLALSGQNRPSGSLPVLPRAGEMVLLPWDAPGGVLSAGEFRYLIVHLPTADFERHAHGIGIPFLRPVSALVGAGAVLAAALRTMANEARQATNRSALEMVRPALVQLILQTFHAQQTTSAEQTEPSDRVTRILSYLEAHLGDERLSALQAARACGLSKRQLFRAFAAADQNFAVALRRMRIDKACDLLLLHRSMPIAEVARSCGFSSSAHFSRLFHDIVGGTPTAYRRRQLAYRADVPAAPAL